MSSATIETINTTIAAGLLDERDPERPVNADPVVPPEGPPVTSMADEVLASGANAAESDGAAPTECQERQSVELAPPSADNSLSAELQRLIDSVASVEELSRQAREAAVGDLALYEALSESSEQYTIGLQQASVLEHDAAEALQRAFGQSATAAAEVLLADAERVRVAFGQLTAAWRQRADEFLRAHPDVELLVAERRVLEEEARRQEAVTARLRRRDSLVGALTSALDALVFTDARRALAALEREFADDVDLIKSAQQRLRFAIREERDLAAREAVERAAQHCEVGDLEAALATLEQVDVDDLSLEVSKDVFGRWLDSCSRLAQASGVYVKRWAPRQGRGVVCIVDLARPRALEVLSSLGMGPDYFAGAIIKQALSPEEMRDSSARRRAAVAERILREARDFRAATVATTGWETYATPSAAALPIHH